MYFFNFYFALRFFLNKFSIFFKAKMQAKSDSAQPKQISTAIPSPAVASAASAIPSLTPKLSAESTSDNNNSDETASFKNQIKDLTEKLETLKLKRSEDREKLREFDKLKLQIQQVILIFINCFSNVILFKNNLSCKSLNQKLKK